MSKTVVVFLFQLTLMNFGKEQIPSGTSSNNQKNAVSLREQVEQFLFVRDNLLDIMGSAATKKFLSKCLFFVSIGSNDILGYYYSMSSMSKTKFLESLVLAYKTHLKVNLFFHFSVASKDGRLICYLSLTHCFHGRAC